MKFLMVDDEHDLYRVMMADLFRQKDYDVEEIPRMNLPAIWQKLYNLHYTYRFDIPFKFVWGRFYALHKYPFQPEETYIVLFMNGSFRKHFDRHYLEKIKRKHPNVKLALLLFDHSTYFGAIRCLQMRDVFDYAFSFDVEDCRKYNMEKFYTCFSIPENLQKEKRLESTAYFVGSSAGRLDLLKRTFAKITKEVENCKFYITEVPETETTPISGVIYNTPIPFQQEMQMAYNTNCVIEVMKPNQTGITLRVCEAVLFNKKLLTNNKSIKQLPFYDARYMSVFSDANDVDVDFLKAELDVQYDYHGEFSPVRILERIIQLESRRE